MKAFGFQTNKNNKKFCVVFITVVFTKVMYVGTPSGRTKTLGLTQPLMSTRSIFWGIKTAGAQG
jgi:hypothetical protein